VVATDLERFVSTTVERWGRLDGLVNNAAVSATGPFESISDDEWGADLDLKLLAAIRGTRLVLPHLRAAGGGTIVNVLNTYAKTPDAGSMPTSVSRAAGLAMTKALSRELGPDNVRVNAVMVGRIVSGQFVRWSEQTGRPLDEILEQTVRDLRIPLGRVGRAEEFADLVALLVSPRGAYVSGAAINLDGGLCEAV
jgi:NAD(P)-dependent dehydrogenase (short-subunit alcohol dehydrogenase family)